MRWNAGDGIEQFALLHRIECQVIVMYCIGVTERRAKVLLNMR